MTMPTVVVVGRSRAHEVLLLAAAVIIGVAYLAGAPRPNSVNATLPAGIITAAAVLLVVTGLAGLAGCYWRTRLETALGLERGAMLGQAGALLLYTIAAVSYAGGGAVIVGILYAGWAAANLARAVEITRDLRRLR